MSAELDFIKRTGSTLFDSYFVVDAQRRIQSFGEGLVSLLGLRPSERRKIPGQPCYELLQLEICRERCIALTCLELNRAVRLEEIRGTTPDGREIVVDLRATPIRDDDGQIQAVLVTHRDGTDERRLKTEFDQVVQDQKTERETLLRIIQDRDTELDKIRSK